MNDQNHELAANIFIIEKKYQKVFFNYDELAEKLNEHFQMNITGEEINDFEDNYYLNLEIEDRRLILKNILE